MIFYKTTRVGIFLKGVLLFNRNETNRDASSKEIGRTFKIVSFSEKSLQLSELVLSARLFYLTLKGENKFGLALYVHIPLWHLISSLTSIFFKYF